MGPKGVLIERMTAWLEQQIESKLGQNVDADALTRQIGTLTNLYVLKQTSVRMARQQALVDAVREESAASDLN